MSHLDFFTLVDGDTDDDPVLDGIGRDDFDVDLRQKIPFLLVQLLDFFPDADGLLGREDLPADVIDLLGDIVFTDLIAADDLRPFEPREFFHHDHQVEAAAHPLLDVDLDIVKESQVPQPPHRLRHLVARHDDIIANLEAGIRDDRRRIRKSVPFHGDAEDLGDLLRLGGLLGVRT